MGNNEIEDFHIKMGLRVRQWLVHSVLFSIYRNAHIYPELFLFKQRVWYEVVRSAHCHCRRHLSPAYFVANGRFTFSGTNGGRIPGGIPRHEGADWSRVNTPSQVRELATRPISLFFSSSDRRRTVRHSLCYNKWNTTPKILIPVTIIRIILNLLLRKRRRAIRRSTSRPYLLKILIDKILLYVRYKLFKKFDKRKFSNFSLQFFRFL